MAVVKKKDTAVVEPYHKVKDSARDIEFAWKRALTSTWMSLAIDMILHVFPNQRKIQHQSQKIKMKILKRKKKRRNFLQLRQKRT